MRRLVAALILSLCGCGGPPLLAGAPRPDPGVVAAIAAGIAAGATLADPASAGKRPEGRRVSQSEAPSGRRETVPPDVLDRLDDAQRDAGP
jgi:hypothetical protein